MVGEDGTAGATRCPPLSQPTGRRPLGRLLAWTRRRRRRDLGPPAGEEAMGVAKTRRRRGQDQEKAIGTAGRCARGSPFSALWPRAWG